MSDDFCWGFLVGLVVAGIVGVLFQQIRWAYLRMTAVNRPQVVVHRTDRTPWQVFMDSVAGGFWLVLLIVGILGLLYLASRFLF